MFLETSRGMSKDLEKNRKNSVCQRGATFCGSEERVKQKCNATNLKKIATESSQIAWATAKKQQLQQSLTESLAR